MQKILLVEDQMDFQLMALNCLRDRYLVTVAPKLADAEELLRSERFDLVLMDVMLPDGNGFEFIKRMKDYLMLSHVPVVFLTSKSEVDDRTAGLLMGAQDYIVKPYKPREFTERISARLNAVAPATESSVRGDGRLRFHLLK